MGKKAVSPIIGYVLLITFVIILGVIVYNWMKTYVPSEDLACPDGTSIFIKDYTCSGTNLTITLKNNGKFNVGGYFIYVATSANQELATTDLSVYYVNEIYRLNPGVKFSGELNSLAPMEERTEEFNLTGFEGTIYSIEIVPIRWQENGRLNQVVSCSSASVSEEISCS